MSGKMNLNDALKLQELESLVDSALDRARWRAIHEPEAVELERMGVAERHHYHVRGLADERAHAYATRRDMRY